jgi:hypothetical protein
MLRKRVFSRLRLIVLVLLLANSIPDARGENVLFFGNSFTFGASVPILHAHGGVPKLVEAIARAKGFDMFADSVTAGGMNWSYHLAQPVTAQALANRVWDWVVLQDESTRPTRIGNVGQFMRDGEIFSDRIAQHSPHAGILLFETWARPPGFFYLHPDGNRFTGPPDMMADLHQSYARLGEDLAARNKQRPVRVAPVGTAFARCRAEAPEIPLDARDRHHSTPEGYYLVALVIEETLHPGSVKGAPVTFFQGAMTIPPAEAVKLWAIADEVAGG